MSESKHFSVFEIWEDLGITEHEGGIYATRRLIESCDIQLGQHILYIGCGTAYTASLLAKEYDVTVVASDISSRVLGHARKRIVREDVSDKVTIMQADAQDLPHQDNTFDAVIAESLLVFCDPEKVSSEAYRVLKPKCVFGDNELTCLKHPPDQLRDLLLSLTIRYALLEDEWQAVFRNAGFIDVSSRVYKINPLQQALSHLKVDGVRRYFSALSQGILNPAVRAAFFNKDMLKGWFQYPLYVGYGLYVNRKS